MSQSERRIAELEAEVAKLRHLLSQQLRSDDTIWSDGGVNEHGHPFVTLRWGDVSGQFTVSEMRDFAVRLIQTADAAEYDAAVYRSASETMGLDDGDVASLIAMVREFRGKPQSSSGEAKATPKIIPNEED